MFGISILSIYYLPVVQPKISLFSSSCSWIMMDDKSFDVIPQHGDASIMLWDVHNCTPTMFPTDATISQVKWRMQRTRQGYNTMLVITLTSRMSWASTVATTLSGRDIREQRRHRTLSLFKPDMSSTQNTKLVIGVRSEWLDKLRLYN